MFPWSLKVSNTKIFVVHLMTFFENCPFSRFISLLFDWQFGGLCFGDFGCFLFVWIFWYLFCAFLYILDNSSPDMSCSWQRFSPILCIVCSFHSLSIFYVFVHSYIALIVCVRLLCLWVYMMIGGTDTEICANKGMNLPRVIVSYTYYGIYFPSSFAKKAEAKHDFKKNVNFRNLSHVS